MKKATPPRIGYKATVNCIVTLHVDERENNEDRAGVEHGDFAAFRCKSAAVIAMRNFWTGESSKQCDYSYYDVSFTYELGEIVTAKNYNSTDKNLVFTGGIHYYKCEEAAEAEFTLFNEKRLRKQGIPFKMVLTQPQSGRIGVKKWYGAKGELKRVEYYNRFNHCCGVDEW